MPHHHSKDDRRRPSPDRRAKQSRPVSPGTTDEAPILDVDGDIDLATLASAGGRFNLAGAGGAGVLAAEGLNAKVLVLNKLYVAVRVVSARRAFCLLSRNIAEVIHVESGNDGPKYVNYDFESWTDVAALRTRFERAEHDWVRTVRFEIAVPRIIRLLGPRCGGTRRRSPRGAKRAGARRTRRG